MTLAVPFWFRRSRVLYNRPQRYITDDMGKVGPKELARRALRETQKRSPGRVKPVPATVASNAPSDHVQRTSVAVLYAPAGECQWCDARRAYAREGMRRLRAKP